MLNAKNKKNKKYSNKIKHYRQTAYAVKTAENSKAA